MPKIVNVEEVKRDIILNAIEVFDKNGYYSSNIEDISKAAGMNRTTIYCYFKNKEDIFENSIYYIIDTIENDIESVSSDLKLNAIEKIEYLNEKWNLKFENVNVILLLVELWLALRREKGDMFKRIRSRIKDMEHKISSLTLEDVKYMKPTLNSDLKIDNSFIILSILQLIPNQASNVKGNLLSMIAAL